MSQTQLDTTTYTAAIREHDGALTVAVYEYVNGDHGRHYADIVVSDVTLAEVPDRLAECGWRVTTPWLDSLTGQGMARVATVVPVAVQPASK